MHRILKKRAILADRASRGLKLERVYRELYEPEYYLQAYGKIYRNRGAMTPGVDGGTADGTSLELFRAIITSLKDGSFDWRPAKRIYIPKRNGKLRPLGLPGWTDKIVQEVMRSILEPYFEARFRDSSHGFRPDRGCHTALTACAKRFRGCSWFIEGDIKGCFDNIDHDVLLGILRESIDDERFIQLVSRMLKAGYLEDWRLNETLSGTPQGGILSPLLANIYLDKLDAFVEETLYPRYNRGTGRRGNPEYKAVVRQMAKAKAAGDAESWARLRSRQRSLPSLMPDDPHFRRLHYVRYADDFILGFTGPKAEATEIKDRLGEFLRDALGLELSPEKTLITHARTEKALFLGYEIGIMHDDDKVTPTRARGGATDFTRRCINGQVWLGVPASKVDAKCREFMIGGKIRKRLDQMGNSEYSIVSWYQSVYRGFANYYLMAHDVSWKVSKLKWVMTTSLLKTLAAKRRSSCRKVAREIKRDVMTPDGPVRAYQVRVPRPGRDDLVATFGGLSLRRRESVILDDTPVRVYNTRTELLERLLRDVCELCGSGRDCEVHHVRKIADLAKKSKANQVPWVRLMITRSRKTLVLCRACHVNIHRGRIDGSGLQ
ncbi:reverse transcriptase/maturase family protein [Tautonia marina]|uniref:reverse transcriptase/maturase family protein n=1 Tax=Tautonia marina TaxID=2653855 RepID=UPI00126054B5|nr:reverse transcriptase/maturase family protein [Tautonia marina]